MTYQQITTLFCQLLQHEIDYVCLCTEMFNEAFKKRNFSEPMKPRMESQATGATVLQPVRERRRVQTLATTSQTLTNTGPWNSLISPAGEVEFVILTTLLQAVFYLKKQTNWFFLFKSMNLCSNCNNSRQQEERTCNIQ